MRITHSNGTKVQLAGSYFAAGHLDQRGAQYRARPVTWQCAPTGVSKLARNCGGAVLALLVGTGGVMTPGFVEARESRGYPLQCIQYAERSTPSSNRTSKVRTSAENLAFVRDSFKAPMTELAAFFGVSRQAVYNWQAGEPISAQNEELLRQAVEAATVLHREGIAAAGLIKRKLPGGATLFERLRHGESGRDAAKALVSMISKESRQREIVTQRLKGRSHAAIDVADAGTSHLGERV